MFIVTLLTAPAERGLSAALVDTLRDRWGGGAVTWLSVDEAAEFRVDDAPRDAPDVWQAMQDQGVDLVIQPGDVQPGDGRRKMMLLADMDSTMIRQECIDELAAEAGVGDRVAAITARAMNGELEFEAALIERVALLRGMPETMIDTVLADRITLMPGGYELVQTMKAHGAHTVLVSGGFTAFTGRIATALGFDEHRANVLLIENGKLTGQVARPILGQMAKLNALDGITYDRGLDRADVIAVGDGMNDLLMLHNAGIGVALHGKPALQAQVDKRINHGDLTALLFLQGYARADFVT